MTISAENNAAARLDEIESRLVPGPGRDAFRVLIDAATSAVDYEIEPAGQPSTGKQAVNYLVDGQSHYAFIVNAEHLLFYYRKPSGLPSPALVEVLASKGLVAALNQSGEVTVRITTPDQARVVLEDITARLNVGNHDSDWTDEELRAAVVAYRELQRRDRAGEKGAKAAMYRDLGVRFQRTPKAFEFRMQNISAVLALMGRDWIPGLKPAKHIGTQVAARIEQCINDLEGSPNPLVAAFELGVAEKVRRKAVTQPKGQITPLRSQAAITSFARDPAVKAWVLQRAQGVCECCRKPAPFKTAEDTPYLEVHHIRTLADGGSDRVSNTVALCPNCHRQLHYGVDRGELKQRLFSSVHELVEE